MKNIFLMGLNNPYQMTHDFSSGTFFLNSSICCLVFIFLLLYFRVIIRAKY